MLLRCQHVHNGLADVQQSHKVSVFLQIGKELSPQNVANATICREKRSDKSGCSGVSDRMLIIQHRATALGRDAVLC